MGADQIGIALKGRRNGSGWLVRCPVPSHGKGRGDHSPSLSVTDGDDGRLLLRCFAACEFIAILDALKRLGLVDDGPKFERARTAFPQLKKTTGSESRPSDFPLQLWSEAFSARGTLAEKYLTSRQLALPDRHNEVLRFHPSCPFGKGVRLPCMVALYRDIKTNEPKAIHRTALAPDGKKTDRKALGPKAGLRHQTRQR